MSKPVLLIRSAGNEEDAAALAEQGITALVDPYLKITTSANSDDAEEMLMKLKVIPDPIWLVATSVNAIECWAELVGAETLKKVLIERHELKFAAIGEKTASILMKYGAKDVLIPKEASAAALVTVLSGFSKANLVLPSGNIAMKTLPFKLNQTGWIVHRGIVYDTEFVKSPPKSVDLIKKGEIAAIIFRSPSSVRAFFSFVDDVQIPLICAGDTTARELESLKKECAIISDSPKPVSVAQAVKKVLESM